MQMSHRIRAAREALNAAQADLARQIPVSQTCWSNWEAGRTTPRDGNLKALAKVLNVSVDHLRGEEPVRSDPETTSGILEDAKLRLAKLLQVDPRKIALNLTIAT